MTTMVSPTTERTLSVHQEHDFLLKLERAGLNTKLAQEVIDSKENELAKKLVRLIENGGFEPSTNQKRAREIMDKNFFGVEEAIRYFGVNPSRQQLACLGEIPFAESTLEACKTTHVLVAVFPLSILDIHGICRKIEGQTLFYKQDWYNNQSFAKERGEISWHLVRKAPVTNSMNKNWTEQQGLLGKDEETPSARVMVYGVIGHFLATGERLFKELYVRCVDLDSDGGHVNVGSFNEDGLLVASYWGDDRISSIGVSSARKSE